MAIEGDGDTTRTVAIRREGYERSEMITVIFTSIVISHQYKVAWFAICTLLYSGLHFIGGLF